MDSVVGNPARNCLAAGVDESDVLEAIAKSGYPLQTRVTETLSSEFYIQEEWSYKDRDSSALRSLDILASKRLVDIHHPQPKVTPAINLLIECKQSDLPFIFFESNHPPALKYFPTIAGLKSESIELITDDDPSTWTISTLSALGLDKHKFISDAPISSTFSKCARRSGKSLELSGEESYNGIVLPLIKAAAHFEHSRSPRSTYQYFSAGLTIPIAVVNAPMVLVNSKKPNSTAKLSPWVRVARHEYEGDSDDWQKDRLWAIDVVHEDYLSEYLSKHAMPFAEEFARLTLKHPEELASGKGFVPSLGRSALRDCLSQLKPRARILRAQRATSILVRILSLPFQLWKSRN
ncbi:hypothetical protein ACSPX5_08160 [Pseudomonas sp. HLG18]|uniref:hypothetical protein n=1 Tax=Pseudomonas sp. HLG18 TaxID=3449277 RepID=UPI003F747496